MPEEPAEILRRCLGDGRGHNGANSLPRKKILAFAAVSTQPCAIKFMKALRTVAEQDKNKLSFEAMCVFARVNPVEMLGAILMAAKSMKATESALKAIMAHPDVVQATVDAASLGIPLMSKNGEVVKDENGKVIRLNHGDVAAQRIMHEAVGFLPSKKGGGIEINFGFGRPAEDRDPDSDADSDWDDAFPSLGDAVQEWSADKHKLLEGEN